MCEIAGLEEVAGDEQRNVAEGKEDWEAATFILKARATCEATFIVAAAEKEQSRDGNNQQTEDILDKEIELIRRLMVKPS